MKSDDINNIWTETLKLLQTELSEVIYNTWIKTLEPFCLEDNFVVLQTSEHFYKNIIEERYLKIIKNILQKVCRSDVDVKIIIKDKKQKSKKDRENKLNPKYIFENFIKGKSNELAYAAALAVAESPGQNTYNPLFLYGGVGLGKTHLMHSIGNYVLSHTQNSKIIYASTETFTNELINSIRERKNREFRERYRDIDILLIDDIQFLSDKEGTQEEFFYTFNTLYDANKQIVISSDKPPKEIKTLEDRLRSRFGCGLIVDITLPDFETRTAIVEKKAELDNIKIPSEVTKFIAKNIVSNIRELEGALNKVVAYSRFNKLPITIELANKALFNLAFKSHQKDITVEYIQQTVAKYYDIKLEDICDKKRTQNIVYPRQIAMYLSRKLVDMSLPKIGAKFGGRDHATIVHGYEKISNELKNNQELQKVIDELERRVKCQSN